MRIIFLNFQKSTQILVLSVSLLTSQKLSAHSPQLLFTISISRDIIENPNYRLGNIFSDLLFLIFVPSVIVWKFEFSCLEAPLPWNWHNKCNFQWLNPYLWKIFLVQIPESFPLIPCDISPSSTPSNPTFWKCCQLFSVEICSILPRLNLGHLHLLTDFFNLKLRKLLYTPRIYSFSFKKNICRSWDYQLSATFPISRSGVEHMNEHFDP